MSGKTRDSDIGVSERDSEHVIDSSISTKDTDTADNALDLERFQTKKRKSAYSRKGCLQCKKAHTKCDEKKPRCSRCAKRCMDCTYKNNFVFQKNEIPRPALPFPFQNSSVAITSSMTSPVNSTGLNPMMNPSLCMSRPHPSIGLTPLQAAPNNTYLQPATARTLPPLHMDNQNQSAQQDEYLQLNSSSSNVKTGLIPELTAQLFRQTPKNNASTVLPVSQQIGSKSSAVIGNYTDTKCTRDNRRTINSACNSDTNTNDVSNNDLGKISDGNTKKNDDNNDSNDNNNNKNSNKNTDNNDNSVNTKNDSGASNTSNVNLLFEPTAANTPNFPTEMVDVRDYIYISPTDWNFLNLLRFDQRQTSHQTPDVEKDPLINLFKLSWREASNTEMHSIFSSYDPVQLLYATENPSAATTIPLDDPKLLNFIWTLVRATMISGNLVLFPYENHFDPLLRIFMSLSKKYPLMKDVFVYVSSLFMKDTYYNSNLKYFSHIWDRYIRMPTLKRCLDQLTASIQKTGDFCDHISLTFTVTLLFAANSATKSSNWRTHLRGVHGLFTRVDKLTPNKSTENHTQQEAHECYLFLKDWFCHAEVLAWITSDNGGCFDNEKDLKYLLLNASYSQYNVLNGKFDLIRGYTSDYYLIFTAISSTLLKFKKNGVLLSGTNMLKSLYTETDGLILKELKQLGLESLANLEKIRIDDEYLDRATAGLSDLRLKLSMKNCTRMYHLALALYLEVFFIRKPISIEELKPKLEKMMECLLSIPYSTTSSIACHWPIYSAAVISLLINDRNLYDHFISVLSSISKNGLCVAANSIERLTYISKILSYGDYKDFVDPSHDYIVY